jgi:hypothetical protein
MFARITLGAGFVVFVVIAAGCKNQPAASGPATAQVISSPHSGAGEVKTSPAAETSAEQPAQPDDASLLARKTAAYANDMAGVLAHQPASRPSLVQWVDPANHPTDTQIVLAPGNGLGPAPVANRPATLAAVHLKEDTSVPLILPESADQAPAVTPDVQTTPTNVSTDEYELKLRKLVQDYPRDLGNQLDYQLLRLVRDEPTPDLSDVSQLSPEDRDILLALMDGLTNFRSAARNNGNLMLNRKIRPLLEMSERLRSQGQLAIPTVAFCSQVSSFGQYRPMASSRFYAGRENPMIVYSEAANFTSIQGNDGMWRTRLREEIVLYTDTGLAVWPDKSNAVSYVDQSRARRHDFFIPQLIRLPSSLAVGKYLMKITLTDEESNRVVEATSPLEIISNSESTDAQPAADRTSPAPTPNMP